MDGLLFMNNEKRLFNSLCEQHINTLDGYTHVRAYHACRPLSIDSYLTNGIMRRGKKELLSEALIRLGTLDVEPGDIENAFNAAWDEYHYDDNNRGVYLNLSKEILLQEATHYLIYGGELFNATAVKLASNEWEADHYRDELKKTGIPSLFVCDIPLEDILPGWELSVPLDCDCSIIVSEVRSENIVDIIHPKKMKDVYYKNKLYVYDEG